VHESDERLWAEKAELRGRLRAARQAISDAHREPLARAMAGRVLALGPVRIARTVLLFSSFGSEISTAPLAAGLADLGKRLLLPFLDGASIGAAEFDPGFEGGLVDSTYGPREPASRTPVDPLDIDAAIVPGLAFDRQGYRLGYGGGYYDRYLRGLRAEALRIGVGFSVQVVDAVPHGPGDERVDVVVTDQETIPCSPRGAGSDPARCGPAGTSRGRR